VRPDRGQLVEEVVEVDDEILEDREVRKGFDGDRALAHVPDVGAAGEPRAPVDVRAAGPADPHATGPPEGEGRIEMILDVIQSVQDDHVAAVRDSVLLERRPPTALRPVPAHPEDDLRIGHQYFLSAGCHFVIFTGRYSIRGAPYVRKARVCFRKFASSRCWKSVRLR